MQYLCTVSPHAAALKMDDDLLIPGPDVVFALQTWMFSSILQPLYSCSTTITSSYLTIIKEPVVSLSWDDLVIHGCNTL